MAETPEQSTSWGSMLAGLLIGTAVGVGVSLLYAPKPGKEMRDELSQRLDELKERIDETAREIAATAKTRLDEVRTDLAKAVDEARTTAAEHAGELSRRMES